MTKVVFLGDIVGRSGRDAVLQYLPDIKNDLKPDVIIINSENAAGGFGLTDKIAEELFAAGASVLTLGNHTWDQQKTAQLLSENKCIARPINYPKGTPGSGAAEFELPDGRIFVVINAMGQLFMEPLENPFPLLEEAVAAYPLKKPNIAGVLIDFHAEATSEKNAVGHIFDGRVSVVVGTHTHVPTADQRILKNGTAYQTDAGMCGDYGETVIGMQKDEPIARFQKRIKSGRFKPGEGQGTVSGLFVKLDRQSGLALEVKRFNYGPELS